MLTGIVYIGAKFKIELLQQFAILIFWRDNINDIVQLLAEQFQGFVIDALSGVNHFA